MKPTSGCALSWGGLLRLSIYGIGQICPACEISDLPTEAGLTAKSLMVMPLNGHGTLQMITPFAISSGLLNRIGKPRGFRRMRCCGGYVPHLSRRKWDTNSFSIVGCSGNPSVRRSMRPRRGAPFAESLDQRSNTTESQVLSERCSARVSLLRSKAGFCIRLTMTTVSGTEACFALHRI